MSGPDEAHDPHLREALRHAPDAQVQAPAALSDFILKEARAKARDARPAVTATPSRARRVWDWLARPAVATGFAGVMAATLVGLMWWDEPMDEALPRSPVPATAPMVERPAPAPAPVAPVITPTVPFREAPGTSRAPEPARKSTAGAPSKSAAPAPRQEAPPAAEHDRRDARAERAAGAVAEAAKPAAPVQAFTPQPAPPPAPAAAPIPVPAAPQAADTTADTLLAKAKKADEQKRERIGASLADMQSRRAEAKAQLNESRLQLEAEAYTRVASVRAEIASDAARWSWQRANGSAQPMSDAVYAWLAQLDSSTGPTWQPRSARETTALRGRTLTLRRDGQLQHSFQLTERGVLWQRGQTAWIVELPADTLAALQAALDTAAP